MQFIDQEVTVSLTEFARKIGRAETIAARVCGQLAYHQSLTWEGYWSITHIPTGYAVADHISTEQGAQIIISLALESDIDWDRPSVEAMEKLKGTPEMTRFVQSARAYF